ncbi:Uncharacterised protein [Mycobacterium tuberculosis]|nr:Uncharacterised protein [Mycobacterium tuberculosis]
MGHRVDTLSDRQRANLTTGATDRAIRLVVLALLTVDGVVSALAGALLMPWYIGSAPFPISALISGLVNAALVWAAARWTTSSRVAALPLWAWLLTVAAMSFGGPGDDVILGGQGLLVYGAGVRRGRGRATGVGAVAAQGPS